MHDFFFFAPKVFVATICGFIIGLEREINNKPAGLRTNIMVCAGSCILTTLSFYIAQSMNTPDPTRIIGQIVTGIGFIGGGVIFKSDNKVNGITSASLIFVVCGIGILCGSDLLMIGFLLTIGLLLVSVILQQFEKHFHNKNSDKI